jgi:hypothetical protein
MNESRRAKRRPIAQAIEVIDAMTESPMGRLGNLSQTGMLLISEKRVCEDALFQVSFALPDGSGRQRQLQIGVQHLWCEEGAVPGQAWCGFRFIDIAPADADFLRLWVEHPGIGLN